MTIGIYVILYLLHARNNCYVYQGQTYFGDMGQNVTIIIKH